jgi:deoxycytidylate deaminase
MSAVPSQQASDAKPTLVAGKAPSVDGTAEATGSLTPELVVALCGPIGSPLHTAADQFASALAEFGYLVEKVRLSQLIRINAPVVGVTIDTSTRFHEIRTLIAAGDELRREHGRDILAKVAIAKIGADRRKKYGEFTDVANEASTPEGSRICEQRICHVIDSIKNTAELDLLRLIYGDALFAVGVFSPLEVREYNLKGIEKLSAPEIEQLIDTDSGEEFSHGQSVRDTFPRCDFFVRIDSPVVGPSEPRAVGQLVEKLRRFLRLIFRTDVVTPTEEEMAMYAAASAAKNSACISRQVGAAVTSGTGEVLAVGWNDVPRSGGGLYGKAPLFRLKQAGSTDSASADDRCFAQAGSPCHNDREKRAIAEKIVELLAKGGWLDGTAKVAAVDAIVEDSRVKDLIEFSRAVHAEMHAILGASRVAGDRVLGGKLFVTTYPCHSCARHIIAAGVAEVIYIEPYRKSLATKLHGDSISESVMEASKVRILQFDGIAPRRFIDLFEGGTRKEKGVLKLKGRKEALPSTHVSLRAIPRLEEVVVAEVQSKQLRLAVLVQDGGTVGQDDSPDKTA